MLRVLFAALLCVAVAPPALAKTTTIKLATLAPEGSSWWKVFKEAAQRFDEATQGRVKVRIYAGGVAGDEVDVVRKMRVGQLQAAAITSVGLAQIEPSLLVLQAPGLVYNWEELDYVRGQMKDRFAKMLADKGFATLLWGDVGFNRVFANKPVKMPKDMVGTKPWCWTQDDVYHAYFRALGVQPVLLGVPEVLPALQTGMADAFVTAPLAAVSLQWFARVKYMLDLPQAVTIGAVLISQKVLDELAPEDRAALLKVSAEFAPKLAQVVRSDGDKAIDAVRKAGIQVLPADAAATSAWANVAQQAADGAANKVYPAELLTQARQAVQHFRTGK